MKKFEENDEKQKKEIQKMKESNQKLEEIN